MSSGGSPLYRPAMAGTTSISETSTRSRINGPKPRCCVFGSGWASLVLDDSKKLSIEPSANQDSPICHGKKPLLGIDVWWHAYYLKYQNRHPEYDSVFFNVINWDFVSERYQKFLS